MTAPVEVVTWLDHAGPYDALEDAELVSRRTVGFVVRETVSALFLASTLDGAEAEPCEVNVIGHGMITHRERL